MKVGVVSLGCSKNRVDSETMMSYLNQDGYELTSNASQADIVVVNTCGFIESAKQESIDAILEMSKYKTDGNCTTLVVTGCLAQRYYEELRNELPEVDILLGVSEYEKLPSILDARYPQKLQHISSEDLRYDRVLSTPSHYAYLRIADGCDNRCSFCAIPNIRGRFKSKSIEALVDEAKNLLKRGVKELIVIAQDTTNYGRDLYGKACLPELLKKLCEIDFHWIRVLYTYPEEIDASLLDLMQSEKKLLPYLDMPIQHVDNILLKHMNRRGNREELQSLISDIRTRDERFVLRTTFIVGFPGETQEAFDSLCSFVKEFPFDRVGVFTYSPEEGTKAATMDNQVDLGIAESRRDELMRIQNECSSKLLKKRIGTHCEVIVEYFDEKSGYYVGRSYAESPDVDGCILIRNSKENELTIGEFIQTKIVDTLAYDLIAEVTR